MKLFRKYYHVTSEELIIQFVVYPTPAMKKLGKQKRGEMQQNGQLNSNQSQSLNTTREKKKRKE